MTIRIEEYGTATANLTTGDLAFLLDLVKGAGSTTEDAKVLQSLTPTSEPGVYKLRAGAYIGRLALPSGMRIDFAPRLPNLDVLEIIRVAMRLPSRLDTRTIDASDAPFLIDSLAGAYCTELERIVGRGLYKTYENRTHVTPPYAGHVDVAGHLRYAAGRPDRLVTRSRRLSTDNISNRLLATGLELLRRLPLQPTLKRRVTRLLPAFATVLPSASARDLARVPRTTLVNRYQDALSLAAILLSGRSVAPVGEGARGVSILFYMPTIWEEYVYLQLRETHGDNVKHGHVFPLSDAGHSSTADVVLMSDGRPIALADAKYRIGKDAPSADEIYQMVTYCDRLGLDKATLVYPGRIPEREIRVGNKRLRMVGLIPSARLDFALDTDRSGCHQWRAERSGL